MKHQKSPSVMKLCIGAASCIFFGLIMSQLYGQTWPPNRQNDRSLPDVRSSSAAASDPTLTSLEASSSIFESTLRSCLGANCFDKDAHDSNGIAIDRVGLLAPINSGGEEILLFMTKYIEQPRKSKKTPIELVYETHVPPYGYGKNHGWSRIIRLTRKVCPHALSLVAGLKLDEPNSNGGIKNTDMTRHKKFSAAVDIQVSHHQVIQDHGHHQAIIQCNMYGST